MTISRTLLAAALTACATATGALTGAAPAHAAGSTYAYVVNATIRLQAPLSVANAFVVHPRTGGFAIGDTTPLNLDPDNAGGCVQPQPYLIECPESIAYLVLHMSDDDDFVQNDTTVKMQAYGDAGDDRILGGRYRDHLYGGPGTDWIEGRGDWDDVFGGDGDDRMWGGADDDVMNGEAGVDEVHGEDGDDRLGTTDGRDRLLGSYGRDVITASAYVDGGWDDDSVSIPPGFTGEIHGGLGDDGVSYRSWTTGVSVSLDDRANDGAVGSPVTHNVHGDVERVLGSPYDDRIAGGAAGNALYGSAGNDLLYGNGGDDLLDAEQGTAQTTYGGTGHDTCLGSGTVTRLNCEA